MTAASAPIPPSRYLRSSWEVQGRYCPVGPVVQVAVGEEYLRRQRVPTDGAEYHEFLHFAHVASSTIGMLDAALASLPIGNHNEIKDLLGEVPLRQPLIQMLGEVDRKSPVFEKLDGILDVHALRAFLGGYPAEDGDEFFATKARIDRAARLFGQLYGVMFPEAPGSAWDDLDGRHSDSSVRPAAPPYPSAQSFGAAAVFEMFACTAQAAFPQPRVARALTGEGFDEARALLESTPHPSEMTGVFERLATALIAPAARLSNRHPWVAHVSDDAAAMYRAGALFLVQEVPPSELAGDTLRTSRLLTTALAFCELAVNPAIAPGHLGLWTKKPTWHDIHPGYRYTDLCHTLGRLGYAPGRWPDDDEPLRHAELITYLDGVCDYMEWPRHSEVMARTACSSDVVRTNFPDVSTTQIEILRRLNELKQHDLPRVWFAAMPSETGTSPTAVIEYLPDGSTEIRTTDGGAGVRATLLTTLLDELYFSDRLDMTASLVQGFPAEAHAPLAEGTEALLGVTGLADALLSAVRSR